MEESEEESEEEESEEESESEEEGEGEDEAGNGEDEALAAFAKQLQAQQQAAQAAAKENGDGEDDDGEETEEQGGVASPATSPPGSVQFGGDGAGGEPVSARWSQADLAKHLVLQGPNGMQKRVLFGQLPPDQQEMIAPRAGIRPLEAGGNSASLEAPGRLVQHSKSKSVGAGTGAGAGGAQKAVSLFGGGGDSASPVRRPEKPMAGFSSSMPKSGFSKLSLDERQVAVPAMVKELEAVGEEQLEEEAAAAEDSKSKVGGLLAGWMSPSAWLAAAGRIPLVPRDWSPAASKAVATTEAIIVVSAGVLVAIAAIDLARGKPVLASVKENSWRFVVQPALRVLSGRGGSDGADGADPFDDDPFGSSAAGGAAPLTRPAGGGGGGGQ